ncbi:MAG: MMPL family transporter [Gammaproteobacteria bacterium]|nr:MMPL family transporter [Gammaproteobacteria bacterium]
MTSIDDEVDDKRLPLARMLDAFDRLVLKRPAVSLFVIALVVAFFAYHAPAFRLDASADSLVLENDAALKYYRSIRARYGSDDYLIVTYTPQQDLFSDAVIADLQVLRDEIAAMEQVESVVSLLDVPLIESPPVSLAELSEEVPTLASPRTDRSRARQEFLSSPMYRDLIISPDGRTAAMQVNFRRDETWHRLLKQRNELREKSLQGELTADEQASLDAVSAQFDAYSLKLRDQQSRDIAEVRGIIDGHGSKAELHLGGVPMIVSDSIDFIRHDLLTFGIGVLCFLVVILAVAFRKPRWVVLPMLACGATGILMVGFLGLVDWPVTVVSSNFMSLLLILTLSLAIHLVVRYRELHEQSPDAGQEELVREMVRAKTVPCLYTAITTMVAFGSLLFSGIRPVIDFGWMMAIGIAVAFVLVFTLLPAALMFMEPGRPHRRKDLTDRITHFFATQIQAHGSGILLSAGILAALSVAGIGFLTVENRFIDYFKESTEIYRGMEIIDRELGGTTPLDVVIDAPAEFFRHQEEIWDDPLLAEFGMDDAESGGIASTSYWFNTAGLVQVAKAHRYLDSLPDTGKVLSVDTAIRMLQQLDEEIVSDNFELSVLYNKLPDEIKEILIRPYLSEDGNQVRYSVRVFESDPSLQREALIRDIHEQLTGDLGYAETQVHLTGMLVLYNNMLQSLYRSQILTIGVVFLAILFMFAVLFRNAKMATIAIVPNLFAALLVLGLMGWLQIPLDLMTITVAAISIGIAVDDTIHYVHRFTREFDKDGDYWAAVNRSHASIGRAMYYTTVTVTLGFSILVLSNFVPTIYFGLLTGFAMLIALLADLTLLPLLIVRFRPLGVASN